MWTLREQVLFYAGTSLLACEIAQVVGSTTNTVKRILRDNNRAVLRSRKILRLTAEELLDRPSCRKGRHGQKTYGRSKRGPELLIKDQPYPEGADQEDGGGT